MTRILLIEDEPEMARLVAGNIAKAGFLVDRAGSCEEAQASMDVARYGLVLSCSIAGFRMATGCRC